jgi:VIT1/CCC1 family predicted Fe2+/Mn2+ transporter
VITQPLAVHPVEGHRTDRIGWLRAAVLGANDGIISTASLMVGVAAASTTAREVMVAGLAGTVAGALSMAAGEYVSVSSQADTEEAELSRERQELATNPEGEHRELAGIYQSRGLTPEFAALVAQQLMASDALAAHARDELGLSTTLSARPVQAALASAASFAVGAALPLVVAALSTLQWAPAMIVATSLVSLSALGATSAAVGGAPAFTASVRVTFWGALAMAMTWAVGWLFGQAIG